MKDISPENGENEVLLPFWLSKPIIDDDQIQKHWLCIQKKIKAELSENNSEMPKDDK
jgi:hypothetical protein